MTMTENEICRNYRGAKNRPEQIKILADMNCTTVGEIKKILVAGGEIVVEPPKTDRGKRKQDNVKQNEVDESKSATVVDVKPEEVKAKAPVLPDAVMDALTTELETLDMQIKLVSEKLNPLVERYKEIAAFIKSYGSV